ncbi:Rrf2 family transcriptional regulator [Dissulfurispira thermophila]|uniref:Rrf2 family transcriptional regulator n=1 Tax=Dissulfurispira thermophila TaxID=2715679 RepID=A0A7G1H186_9BACT|nr:Rrf2 family transcriptional regulator [Dissulfurispira thermophila]BCB96524.1 Rrf2 family transcriptional regulator [Dissulfurispira thermophila]
MEITRETDYAIRCVLYLSERPDDVVMVEEIAKAKSIPKSFLSKILQKLVKADIVKSYRGVKGGFQIAKSPKQINLLDVIEAVDGVVAMNRCAIDRKFCNLSHNCSIHPIWVELKKEVEKTLKKIDFARLIVSNRR